MRVVDGEVEVDDVVVIRVVEILLIDDVIKRVVGIVDFIVIEDGKV